jgi:hypothetical protein
MLLKWLHRLFTKSNRRLLYEQLQWQRFLLRTGTPSTIRVLDMVIEDDDLLGHIQLRMWVQMKIKGIVEYRHTQTFLCKRELPAIGDTIHIRYCPDDLSKILII